MIHRNLTKIFESCSSLKVVESSTNNLDYHTLFQIAYQALTSLYSSVLFSNDNKHNFFFFKKAKLLNTKHCANIILYWVGQTDVTEKPNELFGQPNIISHSLLKTKKPKTFKPFKKFDPHLDFYSRNFITSGDDILIWWYSE